MYSVYVRDHIMIAHSLRGEVFGPAQQLHGATYEVEVEFRREKLDRDGLVVDIGLASQALKDLLSELNYRNLDELQAFQGQNTTTEFLAHEIFQRMANRLGRGDLGPAAPGLHSMKVSLGESHVAGAAYEGPIRPERTGPP
jgi:6-pyruvoyltetrahydropterin/6-carboxytetrahydropterin synthase